MKRSAFLLRIALGLTVAMSCAQAADDRISRLPRLAEPPGDPDTAAAFAMIRSHGGELINLHLTLGHAGKIFYARQQLTYALRFDATTPRKFRELAILRTAGITGSAYEFAQHAPIARACGFTPAQIDRLDAWQEGGLFDERERALLAYVDQVVGRAGNVDDATFAELSRFFSPREIVELTITATQYVATNLLAKSLAIKPESDGRRAAPDRC
ncbi:carboxymuconolactone decarboxylase family protein [Bradyrhizobium sp. NP1]|uniref:carboxymuconolactone decarboxylase family protein n=1 Tax=Bradyrhizobium sp. NP1 TaxID=3049772 RepID=UPI0025A568E8|nr:carboxymuconolactone decarboxylase family protein [Bradyrhizobium sp. NP1]WJR77281.1 carboxymuconolactone decarboxylase family protein [Bradyrhizobium sp. NP1]